jgi:hypothetical protein
MTTLLIWIDLDYSKGHPGVSNTMLLVVLGLPRLKECFVCELLLTPWKLFLTKPVLLKLFDPLDLFICWLVVFIKQLAVTL